MANKAYRVGYTLERDVKIVLEQEGFTVFRSAGSHSKADLIGMKAGSDTLLIQCKRHKNLMTRRELQDLYDFATGLGCVPIIGWRDKGIHWDQVVMKK